MSTGLPILVQLKLFFFQEGKIWHSYLKYMRKSFCLFSSHHPDVSSNIQSSTGFKNHFLKFFLEVQWWKVFIFNSKHWIFDLSSTIIATARWYYRQWYNLQINHVEVCPWTAIFLFLINRLDHFD